LLFLEDTRKDVNAQAWSMGCSFAWGHGLGEGNDPYPEIVAQTLNLKCSVLSRPGSSIEWSADQLLRSTVKKDDLVVWGLSSINRFSWLNSKEIVHVNPRLFEDLAHTMSREELNHLRWIFFNDNRIKIAIQSVFQVKNFCDQVGANLVLVMHQELSEEQHLQSFLHYLKLIDCYVDIYQDETFVKNLTNSINWRGKTRQYCDYGSADISTRSENVACHPGPITHQIWADCIVRYIKEKKWYE